MAVFVRNLFLSANYTQSEVISTGKKTATGDDFYDFFSKSMGLNQMHTNKEKLSPVNSSGNQRSIRGSKPALNSGKANGTISKDGSEQVQELSVSDAQKPEKQPKNLLYIIDEIMAVLQKLSVFLEDAEAVSTDESAINIVFSEEIESIINQSISRLLEVADYTEGSIGELAHNLAEKLNQILEEGLSGMVSEGSIINTEEFSELVSKMLHEAEKIKLELNFENAHEDINLESRNESVAPDENSIQDQYQAEVSQTEQNEHQSLNSDKALKDNNKDSRSSDDVVNIPDKQKFSTVNLREDIDQAMQSNAADSIQVSEPYYSGPVRSNIITKAEILQQVAEKVEILAGSDRSEMIIQLKPESLGKIELQVIHERGEIIAKFLAENEQVKSILENNMQYLRDSLEKSGVDIQSLSVSVGQHNHTDDRDNYKGQYAQTRLQGIYNEGFSDMGNISHTYGYTGLTGDLYGFTESEINLIA